jgi:hypothetical protein
MADEIELHWSVQGPPDQAMAQWRASPPEAVRHGGYNLEDESYNSLTFERTYLDWPQKLMIILSLGFALLFKGFMQSVFRFTVRFDGDGGEGRSRSPNGPEGRQYWCRLFFARGLGGSRTWFSPFSTSLSGPCLVRLSVAAAACM